MVNHLAAIVTSTGGVKIIDSNGSGFLIAIGGLSGAFILWNTFLNCMDRGQATVLVITIAILVAWSIR